MDSLSNSGKTTPEGVTPPLTPSSSDSDLSLKSVSQDIDTVATSSLRAISVAKEVSETDRAGAEKVMGEVLSVIPREELNAKVSELDRNNSSSSITSHDAVTFKEAYKSVKDEGKLPQTMNYSGISQVSDLLSESLSGSGLATYDVKANIPQGSTKEATFAFLDQVLSQASDGDTNLNVTFLIPGNNDQATPMQAAQVAKCVEMYTDEHPEIESVSVNMLVMGLGGHATTSIFHQFAELEGKKEKPGEESTQTFSGTPEALSLGATLKEAIEEHGIPIIGSEGPIDRDSKVTVTIGQAGTSRDTGENVREAKEILPKLPSGATKPHVALISAVASSDRQLSTFANQMDPDSFESITSLPLPRGEGFIKSLSDHQVVTEFLASRAEQARWFEYQYNPTSTYIVPLSMTEADKLHLDQLYDDYAKLSGQTPEAARERSISEVRGFFGQKFTEMEKSIHWQRGAVAVPSFSKARYEDIKEGIPLKTGEKLEAAQVQETQKDMRAIQNRFKLSQTVDSLSAKLSKMGEGSPAQLSKREVVVLRRLTAKNKKEG